MKYKKSLSLLSGFILGSSYAGISVATTILKGSGLDIFFIESGVILAPIGIVLLLAIEYIGLVSDPGMGGGFLIFALGGYVLWVGIFSVLTYLAIKICFK